VAVRVQRLLADPVLELPDAERCEQKALGARESSYGCRWSLATLSRFNFPRATALPFGSADAACLLTHREVTGVIHGC
jgi:hypothetical protein